MKLNILWLVFLIGLFSCTSNKTKQLAIENKVNSTGNGNGDTLYYTNGKIKQITNTRSGKKNGPCVLYLENGDTLMYGNYEEDKRQGKWVKFGGDTTKFYHNAEKTEYSISLPPENRQVTQTYYEQGLVVKKIEIVYFLGKDQIETETHTMYGKDTLCQQRSWHENGKLSGVNNSVNGLSNDTSRSWREDGTLLYEGYDKMGDMIYLKEFDTSGKKVIRTKTFDLKTGRIIEK